MLSIDINLVFTIINLIVLYLLLKKFLIGPVLGIMALRDKMIKEQFESANEAEESAMKLKAEYEESLLTAKDESLKIVEQAKAEAQTQYDHIIKDANVKADKIVEDAQKTISIEREKTIHDIESEIAGLAMAATRKIVQSKSNDENDQLIYNQFLAKAGDSNETTIQ